MTANVSGVYEQCTGLQEDEIAVLESIYPSLLHVQSNPLQKPGQIIICKVPVSLPSPTTVNLSTISHQPSSSVLVPKIEGLLHLPPLTMRIFLPPSYPVQEAPKPISIRAALPSQNGSNGSWLSKTVLVKVQERLVQIWEEENDAGGESSGALWKWWEWVGSGDFLSGLELIEGGELHLSVSPLIPPSTFHTLLRTYNATQLHSSFEVTAFSCSICLENRKGKSCIQIPSCGCVFCVPCLNSCWSLAIKEGTLENVSCPSVSCIKTRVSSHPREASAAAGSPDGSESEKTDVDSDLVESVVGRELRRRWEQLRECRKAEIDPSYTVCPQPNCQAPVPPPPKSTAADFLTSAAISSRAIRLSEIVSKAPSSPKPLSLPASATTTDDRWARYRICPSCQYSFCLYCSATWHGPHTRCAFPQTSLIIQEYLTYPEGSEGRKRIEARRGKGNLERMVMKWREDEENKRWLQAKTRACAGCGVRVEKSHGCNHMTCGRCNAHFCFRCGQAISPQDPYAHYRKPGSSCFERLFDQEEIDRFERETEMGMAGLQVADEADEWRDPRGFWEW